MLLLCIVLINQINDALVSKLGLFIPTERTSLGILNILLQKSRSNVLYNFPLWRMRTAFNRVQISLRTKFCSSILSPEGGVDN